VESGAILMFGSPWSKTTHHCAGGLLHDGEAGILRLSAEEFCWEWPQMNTDECWRAGPQLRDRLLRAGQYQRRTIDGFLSDVTE
jgi:hypothetical protein